MTSRLSYAKEWMRDGDRLLDRANRRLTGSAPDQLSPDVPLVEHDFARAAQFYLTGAIEYQQGAEGVQRATAGVDDTPRLVQHLEGRLRSEVEAAWQSARPEVLPVLEAHSHAVEPARTFAESLRDRLVHAVPELFDRAPDSEASRDVKPARDR